MRRSLLIALALSLIAVGIVGFGALWAAREDGAQPSGRVGEQLAQLPAFRLPGLDGEPIDSADWQGRVVVINYWATWCPPCRTEMPYFIEAHDKYGSLGLQVVGIAIDQPNLVQDFVDVYNIDFPVMIGGVEGMKLSEKMGNRFDSLPFTAIYDRDGNAVAAQAGAISREQLYEIVAPLLDQE